MLWVSCTGRVGIQSDCSCQIDYYIFTISSSNDLAQQLFRTAASPDSRIIEHQSPQTSKGFGRLEKRTCRLAFTPATASAM
jgi:hypothetical protein